MATLHERMSLKRDNSICPCSKFTFRADNFQFDKVVRKISLAKAQQALPARNNRKGRNMVSDIIQVVQIIQLDFKKIFVSDFIK